MTPERLAEIKLMVTCQDELYGNIANELITEVERLRESLTSIRDFKADEDADIEMQWYEESMYAFVTAQDALKD